MEREEAKREANLAYMQWLRNRVAELEQNVTAYADVYEDQLEHLASLPETVRVDAALILESYKLIQKMSKSDAQQFFELGKAPEPQEVSENTERHIAQLFPATTAADPQDTFWEANAREV